MRQKIATLLIRVSAVVTVAAVAVMIFGPVIWLEFPDVSLWSLIYAALALWAYSPEIRPLRELWIFGIFRHIKCGGSFNIFAVGIFQRQRSSVSLGSFDRLALGILEIELNARGRLFAGLIIRNFVKKT